MSRRSQQRSAPYPTFEEPLPPSSSNPNRSSVTSNQSAGGGGREPHHSPLRKINSSHTIGSRSDERQSVNTIDWEGLEEPVAQPVYFVDVYERNRKLPFADWGTPKYPGDPPRFADITGSVARPLEKVSMELPTQCEWLTEWEVVEDEDAEGEMVDTGLSNGVSPSRSPTTAKEPAGGAFPASTSNNASHQNLVRVKRDAEGWRYGKNFKECFYEAQKGRSCRVRIHRRVFKFKGNEVNTVEVFHPLFRCLITDERFGQKEIDYEMLREAEGSDDGASTTASPRPRLGSVASSAASSAVTTAENALLFNYLPDEMSDKCMNVNCGKKFTVMRRRHHCRACGLLYCGDCSPKRKDYDNVRICESCSVLGEQRKEEISREVALRKEEEKQRMATSDDPFGDTSQVQGGVHMTKFQIEQNLNLENVIRHRIYDSEDKSLTLAAVRWVNAILGDEAESALIADKWEAARRLGGRMCVATITIVKGTDIDASSDPTTCVSISHQSRPKEEYTSDMLKKSSNPLYNFSVSWPIYDDSKPFDIVVMADRTLGKPKEIARVPFVPDGRAPTSKRRVVGVTYTESGEDTVKLKAPRGEASVPGTLTIKWSMEYRNTMEDSDLDFCPNCNRVLPFACTCPSENKAAVLWERQTKQEEEDIAQAQVTSERLHMEYFTVPPPRRPGGSNGAEALNLFRIGKQELNRRRLTFRSNRAQPAAMLQQREQSNLAATNSSIFGGTQNLSMLSMFGGGATATAAQSSRASPAGSPTSCNPAKPTNLQEPSPSAQRALDPMATTMPPAAAAPLPQQRQAAAPPMPAPPPQQQQQQPAPQPQRPLPPPPIPQQTQMTPTSPVAAYTNGQRPRRGQQRKEEGGCCVIQ